MACRISAFLLLGVLGFAGVSCGGDDGPGEGSSEFFCSKLEECNALPGGVSENGCVEEWDRCLGDLTPTERSDWRTGMEHCAEFEGCESYLECWVDVPNC